MSQPTLPGIPEPDPKPFVYDYVVGESFAKDMGMKWLDSWVLDIDAVFAELSLTQDQVDRLLVEYCWRINHLFNPRAYNWAARICLAWHFLFGKVSRDTTQE